MGIHTFVFWWPSQYHKNYQDILTMDPKQWFFAQPWDRGFNFERALVWWKVKVQIRFGFSGVSPTVSDPLYFLCQYNFALHSNSSSRFQSSSLIFPIFSHLILLIIGFFDVNPHYHNSSKLEVLRQRLEPISYGPYDGFFVCTKAPDSNSWVHILEKVMGVWWKFQLKADGALAGQYIPKST